MSVEGYEIKTARTKMRFDSRKSALTRRTLESDWLHVDCQRGRNVAYTVRTLMRMKFCKQRSVADHDRRSDLLWPSRSPHDPSVKPYNDGDHSTAAGILLLAESQSQYRDTILYKMARGRASEFSSSNSSSHFNSLYSLKPLNHSTFINPHHVDVLCKAFHHRQCCPRRRGQWIPRRGKWDPR